MRKSVFILLLFCIALLPLLSIYNCQSFNASAKNIGTIIVDPAHGGSDPGATAFHTINGDELTFFEKDMTLQVALLLKEKIAKNYPDINVILTRNDDTYLSLEDRKAQANSATLGNNGLSLFVSLHINSSYSADKRGYQLFIPAPNYTANNIALAEKVSFSFTSMFGEDLPYLGLVKENAYIPNNSPLVLLVELGFITSPEDITLLHSEHGLEKYATALANGIASYIAAQ